MRKALIVTISCLLGLFVASVADGWDAAAQNRSTAAQKQEQRSKRVAGGQKRAQYSLPEFLNILDGSPFVILGGVLGIPTETPFSYSSALDVLDAYDQALRGLRTGNQALFYNGRSRLFCHRDPF